MNYSKDNTICNFFVSKKVYQKYFQMLNFYEPRVARLPFIAIILLHIFVPLHSVQTISSCSINSNIVSMRNISSFYIRSTTSAAEPNASFAYFALVDSSGNKLYEHGGSEFVAPTASPHVPATAIAGTDYEYMRFTYDSGTDVDGQTLYNLMFAQEMECDVLIVAGGGGVESLGVSVRAVVVVRVVCCIISVDLYPRENMRCG